MAGRTLTLTDNVYDYLLKYGVREPPILARLREATRQIPDSNMQIGADQGPVSYTHLDVYKRQR